MAGATKAYDLAGFADQINHFHLLPWPLVAGLAVFLPWLEMISGILLIVRKLELGALLIITGLLVVFTFALTSAWLRHLDIDCGCFGHALPPMTVAWGAVRDLFLLTLTSLLWVACIAHKSSKDL